MNKRNKEKIELTALLDDEALVSKVTHYTAAVSELADAIPTAPDVAYFSPEFGITDVVGFPFLHRQTCFGLGANGEAKSFPFFAFAFDNGR